MRGGHPESSGDMPCEHGPESMPDGRILRPMAATSGEHCAPMRSNFSAKRSRKFNGREARHVCRCSVLRSVGTSAFLGLFPEVPSYHLPRLHALAWARLPRAVSGRGYLQFLARFLRATARLEETPIGLETRTETKT